MDKLRFNADPSASGDSVKVPVRADGGKACYDGNISSLAVADLG
jgi:hypothetical protein